MSNSINTNIAAYYAQANITTASNASTESVARLSSGNAIIEASDNVAALATGTSLGTQVNALNTAATNASQGSSLLQVADGALAQIQSILQTQQSLALQAESGSLTDTDRGFLNQQFQALTNEIQSLATGTSFNGVNLIDGSIAAGGTTGSSSTLNNVTADAAAQAVVAAGTNSQTSGVYNVGAVNIAGFTNSPTSNGYGVSTVGDSQYTGFVQSATYASGNISGTVAITPNTGSPSVSDPNLVGSLAVSSTTSPTSLGLVSGAATTLVVTNANSGGANDNTAGFNIVYTINGEAFTGQLHDKNGLVTGAITGGSTATLTGTSGATITFTVNTGFGVGVTAANVTSALTDTLANAQGYNAGFQGQGFTGFTNTGSTTAGFTNTIITNPTSGGNDPNLAAALNSGVTNPLAVGATINGTPTTLTVGLNAGAIGSTFTEYAITYTLNGVAYTGKLAAATGVDTGAIAAGTQVILTGAGGAADSKIVLTVGNTAFGAGDNSGATGAVAKALEANLASATVTNSPVITQPPSGNDISLFGGLSSGQFNTSYSGTLGTSGHYVVNYVAADGTTYTGNLADTGSGSGIVAANTSVTLSAAGHATITLTTGGKAFGTVANVDQSTNINAALTSLFAGATATTGSFQDAGAGLITAATNAGVIDPNLYGALSAGTIAVQGGTSVSAPASFGPGGTATGYIISYTAQDGAVYKGFLSSASAGNGSVAGAATATLTLNGAGLGAATAEINLKVGGAFAGNGDNSASITAALQSYLASATALHNTSTDPNAIISGQTVGSTIGSAVSVNNIGKNDTYLVGDLSQGVFSVSGTAASGYSVTYAINGSNYVGNYSADAVANGGSLVLTNGLGSLVFSGITANNNNTTGATGLNASLASATTLGDALTAQFAGASALAIHKVASTETNNVADTAITTADAGATELGSSISGADVTLQSSTFSPGGSTVPSISTFSGTSSGTGTVLSVLIDGVKYSTGDLTLTGTGTTVNATHFDGGNGVVNGTTGVITFFKGGDDTSSDTLTLNLNGASSAALIGTSADVTNFTNALNTIFGSGGSGGGLTFQLGATSDSNVTVNIGSAQTNSLYGGTALDISTEDGATTAASVVGDALNTVTALRAQVGAYESQFNFAASAIQSSTQNESAAKSQLLDTNIATESTNYATEQVQLQAGISVLAQANQQTQALLKLISG